ncbi:MAG: hypothetical protein AB8G86_29120 [Saprospiraceae bacterium]
MLKHSSKIFFLFLLLTAVIACTDFVEDGIEIDYPLSNATLTVEPIAGENGAAEETVSYKITVNANANIKSLIVQSSNEGKNGSGFNVNSTEFDDPFIDHIFGTIQKNTQAFTVRYDYIIPTEISKTRLTFTIIDDTGKVSVEKTISVVPDVKTYTNRVLFAKDNDFYDGFASIDGVVYPNIKDNYSQFTEENVAVQEKIDFAFYYDRTDKNAVLAAPFSSRIFLELAINNSTRFRKLPASLDIDIADITPSKLIELTENEEILKTGALQVDNLKVGDVIAYVTDLASVFSLKTGVLKVTGLHPGSVPRYDGVAFVLECDVVVQK